MPAQDPAQALVDELRRDLKDAARWLVYADWLTQQGDPRGEAIGLEHRLRELGPQRGEAMREQLEALLAGPRARILTELSAAMPEGELPEGVQIEWRHGFVVGLSYPLRLEDLEGLAVLLGHPQCRLLSRLSVAVPEDEVEEEEDFDYDDYDGSPQMHPIAEELVERLLELDLDRITELAVEYTPLPAAGVRRLSSCAKLAGLVTLDLRYTNLDDEGLETLAASPYLAGVRSLHLQRNRISARGAKALAAGPWSRLRFLDLRDNRIGVDGAKALAGSPLLAGVETLRLYNKDVDAQGTRALAESPHLAAPIRRYWTACWSSQ
ncbi:MAG: TIGR02996 domain-containing protein [Myxococcales bacterium]|nr:TIGR02996 domain-containing protein [Myxococcales bacterium]